MGKSSHHRSRVARIALAWVLACGSAAAGQAGSDAEAIATGAGNLLAVLRESAGENKLDEALRPYGPLQATTPQGRRVEFETSWYQYLGDMHIRLVFDGERTLQSASPDDLARLQLTPDEALQLAVANLRRVYGEPHVQPWSGGLMQVKAAAPELTSSYFLDREFWQALQTRHPDGLVVAVPRRGGLVYASARDAAAVESLRFSAAALYAGGPGARLSSALYLFKDGRWSVFQAPQPPAD
ncbi:hypothetical protein RAMLITH_04370 [Ramlibacter sp. RBP-2]|uniref:Outer membrane lipoprotein carrier protein LolA n=1 Tax=Ramlibacter lithotrophicus TaxID=2606681 RepID=A0A7X6DD75_9BURK|nr:hypothetical protein [Ramlibacter lithotrophicus]NKE65045.1 hypothetical protein [Ramlibacter lithotrophicus]